MGLQDFIRLLIPKEDRFFDFLEQQATLAHEGAVVLARLKDDAPLEVKEAVHAVEKRGDKIVRDTEDALAQTFVTPLDREDIQKLSAQLDDILDRAYRTASTFVMFGMDKPSAAATSLIDTLVKATKLLAGVLPALRKHEFERIREVAREIKTLEKEGDVAYREAMTALFADATIEARALIREKEVLEILEDAVDGCEDAAEFLTNLAVKHG